MPINAERDSRIGVAKLRLCNRGRRSAGKKQAGVSVAKGVKATSWNLQRVENWNQMVPNDVLSDEEAP